MPADGTIVVLAGGTSHGVGLEAPRSQHPLVVGGRPSLPALRARAVSLATGTAESLGWALSPFTVAGAKRWFVEPPHMQTSLVFLPRGVTPPRVGDDVPVTLRPTTMLVDEVRDTEK
jgi:hypothetical protein